MLKFLRQLVKQSDPEAEAQSADASKENPLDTALKQGKMKNKPPEKPVAKHDSLELLDEPACDADGGGSDPYNTGGFDPYNTGGFDKRAAWKRVTKR